MKCSTHLNTDATAVCIHCGQALCPGCTTKSESGRVVCSAACSLALLQTELALQNLRTRSASSARISGYFAIAVGVVIGAFGFMEFYNGIARLGYFLVPTALVLVVSGVFYLQTAKRKQKRDNAASS